MNKAITLGIRTRNRVGLDAELASFRQSFPDASSYRVVTERNGWHIVESDADELDPIIMQQLSMHLNTTVTGVHLMPDIDGVRVATYVSGRPADELSVTSSLTLERDGYFLDAPDMFENAEAALAAAGMYFASLGFAV